MNAMGQVVQVLRSSASEVVLHVDAPGLYLITVQEGDKRSTLRAVRQ